MKNINAFRPVAHDHEKMIFEGFCYINLYETKIH